MQTNFQFSRKKDLFLIVLLSVFFLTQNTLHSQVKVANDLNLGTPSHPSAILDVVSTSKGMLPPRMTTSQRNGIAAPAEGLMIYNTTEDCLNEYMSGVWKTYCDLRFNTSCNCVEYLKNNGLSTQVWIPIGTEDWRILGNAGTNPAINFLGTTDNQALAIRTNNTLKWRFEPKGTINFVNTGNSVFIGTLAGANDNLTTNNNTFVGFNTGRDNTNGSLNTAVGANSLLNNTTGWRNTAIGVNALRTGTTSQYNTAVGYDALPNITTGESNISMGYLSMTSCTDCNSNTAIGVQAMQSLVLGNYNVALGRNSCSGNGPGTITNFSDVVGIGRNTFLNKDSGNNSVAVGYAACFFEVTGSHNTGIGSSALSNNTSGQYNSALGYNSGRFPTNSSNFTNTSALGYASNVNASNKIRFGNTNVTVIEGQVAYSWPSDGRFKSNIQENVPGLDFVMGLRPVTYKFDTKKFDEFLYKEAPDSVKAEVIGVQDYSASQQITHTGFVAQEIESLVNELGYDFDGLNVPKTEHQNYSVSYSTFVVPLVKAVQEQQVIIDDLKKKEADTQAKFDELQQKIEALEKLIREK